MSLFCQWIGWRAQQEESCPWPLKLLVLVRLVDVLPSILRLVHNFVSSFDFETDQSGADGSRGKLKDDTLLLVLPVREPDT